MRNALIAQMLYNSSIGIFDVFLKGTGLDSFPIHFSSNILKWLLKIFINLTNVDLPTYDLQFLKKRLWLFIFVILVSFTIG